MRHFRIVSGGCLLVIGGGLSAIGALLAAFLPIAYVEWDAGASASLTALAIALVLAIPGAIFNAIGGWLYSQTGRSLATRSTALFLWSAGCALIAAPLANMIWIATEGAAFNAPERSWSPYLLTPIAGGLLIWFASRLFPLSNVFSLRLLRLDADAQDHA